MNKINFKTRDAIWVSRTRVTRGLCGYPDEDNTTKMKRQGA